MVIVGTLALLLPVSLAAAKGGKSTDKRQDGAKAKNGAGKSNKDGSRHPHTEDETEAD